MSTPRFPWSFYAVIVTFAVFFFSLNVYIITLWLSHPLRSDLWLLGVGIGLVGLIYSIYMVRVHQRELIAAKEQRNGESA
ncbi:MAG: hypothetical protein ACFFD6_07900 [Candidatus Thorarchaeota archaeon]